MRRTTVVPENAEAKYLAWLERQLASIPSTGLTMLDLFCGSGGSSMGAVLAGIKVLHASNHWDEAIAVHALNHQNTDHTRADITDTHPRFFPQTDILWASPECTNHSMAKGQHRRGAQGTLDEEGRNIPAERSRVMMNDVTRFMEYARSMGHAHNPQRRRQPYKYVVVENVVEVASWEGFNGWCRTIRNLGYSFEVVSLNSAFAHGQGFLGTPQLRDRVFVVCWNSRDGIPKPNLDFRPPAWCDPCDEVVGGLQIWKNDRRVGKWNQSYEYVCDNIGCGVPVQPFALPAFSALDLSEEITTIGDRKHALKTNTEIRIKAGLREHGRQPLSVQVGGSLSTSTTSLARRTRPASEPSIAQTGTLSTAFVDPPVLDGGGPDDLQEYARFPDAETNRHGGSVLLATEDSVLGQVQLPNRMIREYASNPKVVATAAAEPLEAGAIRTMNLPELIEAASAFRKRYALARKVEPKAEISEDFYLDCGFRTETAHEAGAKQGFPDEYQMLGTTAAQTKMHGNAVPPPASRLILSAIAAAFTKELAIDQRAQSPANLSLL